MLVANIGDFDAACEEILNAGFIEKQTKANDVRSFELKESEQKVCYLKVEQAWKRALMARMHPANASLTFSPCISARFQVMQNDGYGRRNLLECKGTDATLSELIGIGKKILMAELGDVRNELETNADYLTILRRTTERLQKEDEELKKTKEQYRLDCEERLKKVEDEVNKRNFDASLRRDATLNAIKGIMHRGINPFNILIYSKDELLKKKRTEWVYHAEDGSIFETIENIGYGIQVPSRDRYTLAETSGVWYIGLDLEWHFERNATFYMGSQKHNGQKQGDEQ